MSNNREDRCVGRSLNSCLSLVALVATGIFLVAGGGADVATAQRMKDRSIEPSRSVYQRHRQTSSHHQASGKHRHPAHYFSYQAPAVSSGWFQRPYPYHLDYYRMKYGGSYAPYFGNLYGPPQVVTAPPYFGPYYGGYDYATPYGFNAPVPFEGRVTEGAVQIVAEDEAVDEGRMGSSGAVVDELIPQ